MSMESFDPPLTPQEMRRTMRNKCVSVSFNCVVFESEFGAVSKGLALSCEEGTNITIETGASKSAVKISNVPYMDNVGTVVTADMIRGLLASSDITKSVKLATVPHISRNTPLSETCQVFCQMWDSQQGSGIAAIDGKHLKYKGRFCLIKAGPAKDPPLQCTTCI